MKKKFDKLKKNFIIIVSSLIALVRLNFRNDMKSCSIVTIS